MGRNGLGKSTLLKVISARQLVIPSHLSILHVEQEVVGDDTLALQSVLESDEKREKLLAEEKDINRKMADRSDTDVDAFPHHSSLPNLIDSIFTARLRTRP